MGRRGISPSLSPSVVATSVDEVYPPYYHRHMDLPYAGDAPNNSIGPTIDDGAPMAAVVAVNTINGTD